MAGKRKLAQTSTPASQSQPGKKIEPESLPKPEPQPEPEAVPEPMIENDGENDKNNKEAQEEEEVDEEEEGSEEEEEEDGDEKDPQNLKKPNSKESSKDEEDIVDSDPESLRKLLDLFQKEQLINILSSAASSEPELLKKIHEMADVDPAARKIFVHGLSWDTTADTLTNLFSQYGEIEECKAVIDKATGKSKGYAFILFKTRKGAQNALKEPQKKIGNRPASCQLASLGPVGPSSVAAASVAAPVASEYTQRKIFVSNVGADTDVKKLVEFFGKFGEIEEGPLGLDKTTGKPRGFCLFVYKTVESAKKALEEPHKNFEGQTLHCQKAVDGQKNQKPGFQQRATQANIGGAVGHMAAASGSGYGYNQSLNPALNPAALNPAALTALLASQGVGGLTNILGGPGMQGGYGGGRGQGYGAGGPPYMGQR